MVHVGDLVRLAAAIDRLSRMSIPIVEWDDKGHCGLCDAEMPENTDEWDQLGWHCLDCPLRIAKEILSP